MQINREYDIRTESGYLIDPNISKHTKTPIDAQPYSF